MDFPPDGLCSFKIHHVSAKVAGKQKYKPAVLILIYFFLKKCSDQHQLPIISNEGGTFRLKNFSSAKSFIALWLIDELFVRDLISFPPRNSGQPLS